MRARGLKLRDRRVARHAPEVAPHAGAWIETSMLTLACCRQKSRPMRARGLKPNRERYSHVRSLSRPMRARGLKRDRHGPLRGTQTSRPMRARGLKLPCRTTDPLPGRVAPHAGAWIETPMPLPQLPSPQSRPMRARGLKPVTSDRWSRTVHVAPHAGAWIETRSIGCTLARLASRAPCGRVD